MGDVIQIKGGEESILQEAHRLTHGDRAVTHGSYRENFDRAAAIFNAWTGIGLSGEQINMILQCLKMSREICNPGFRDNRVDMCGYIELRHRMLEDRLDEKK